MQATAQYFIKRFSISRSSIFIWASNSLIPTVQLYTGVGGGGDMRHRRKKRVETGKTVIGRISGR
jgi:hypothetical protein